MGQRDAGSVDYERLSEYFRVLSLPNRLQLLRKLRAPSTVSDIQLSPSRSDPRRNPDRSLSRATVKEHLERLQELGLVDAGETKRNGQRVAEYVVNQARLFLFTEEVKELSLLRPHPGEASRRTRGDAGPDEPPERSPPVEGPVLTLVSGPLQGKTFPLREEGPWRIGRDERLAIPLRFDPFVSGVNAEVREEGSSFTVRDLPGSRNGTAVNWRRLDPDAPEQLAGGDVIGVGRSLLVFREE